MFKKSAVLLAILFALCCIGVALAQPPAPTEAFIYGDLNMQIHKVTIEADGPADVVIASGNASYAQWSPDGKSIVFISSCSVRTMDADGSDQTTLYTPTDGCASAPRWSVSGQKISFLFLSMQSFHLVVMHKDGTDPIDVLNRWGTIFSTFEWVSDEELSFVIREYQKDPVQMLAYQRNGVWATIENGPGNEKLGQFSYAMYPSDPQFVEQFDLALFPDYAAKTKTIDLAWNSSKSYVIVLQEGYDEGKEGVVDHIVNLYLLSFNEGKYHTLAEFPDGFLPQWQPQIP